MATISISAERMAQLEEFAHRNGQDAPAALDAALADYLEWERSDYRESVEAIRQGYEDFLAGRSMPFEEAFEELRVKRGLSGIVSLTNPAIFSLTSEDDLRQQT